MKNKQAIFYLFAANSVSGLAQGVTMLAIPWYFINVAGEQSLYGLMYALITGVSVFWMLYSGTLIDRFDRKHIFLGINVAGAAILLSMAAYGFATGPMSIFVASIAFATTFFIYNIHFPNLYAFAQEITDRKDYKRILSYLEIQHQLTASISGAIGAILLAGLDVETLTLAGYTWQVHIHIAAWELHEIFLLDGCTYILAFVLIAMIRYKSVAEKHIDRGSIGARLQQGVAYLKDHPMLALFGSVSYAVFISVLVAVYFLVPKYTEVFLGSGVGSFSLFRGIYSLGAVMAGVFVARVFQHTKPAVAVIILGLVAASFYYISLFNTNVFVFFGLGLLMGICNAGIRIMRAAYVFNHVPNRVIGRVTSIFNLYHMFFRTAFTLLFALPFFSVGQQVVWAFLILGIFVTASMLLLLFNLRRIERA